VLKLTCQSYVEKWQHQGNIRPASLLRRLVHAPCSICMECSTDQAPGSLRPTVRPHAVLDVRYMLRAACARIVAQTKHPQASKTPPTISFVSSFFIYTQALARGPAARDPRGPPPSTLPPPGSSLPRNTLHAARIHQRAASRAHCLCLAPAVRALRMPLPSPRALACPPCPADSARHAPLTRPMTPRSTRLAAFAARRSAPSIPRAVTRVTRVHWTRPRGLRAVCFEARSKPARAPAEGADDRRVCESRGRRGGASCYVSTHARRRARSRALDL
jgi:hypothetical protein